MLQRSLLISGVATAGLIAFPGLPGRAGEFGLAPVSVIIPAVGRVDMSGQSALALASVFAVYAGACGRWRPGPGLYRGVLPALFTLGAFLCACPACPSGARPSSLNVWPWLVVLALAGLLPGILLVEFASRSSLQQRAIAHSLRPLAIYLTALALFVGIYGVRLPVVMTAPAIAVAAAYLALQLWRVPGDQPQGGNSGVAIRRLVDSSVVGLVTGQVAWPLLYWPSPALVGGLALLAVFYVASGVVQPALERGSPGAVTHDGRVRPGLATEYVLIGLAGLTAIVSAVLLAR